MLEALVRRGVLQHIGCVQGIADELHVQRRIVPVALDILHIEPGRPDGIAHDVDVGALLCVQGFCIQRADARLDVAQQVKRGLDPGRAVILQRIIEHRAVVLVIADAGRGGGRQRQAAEHEIVHDLVELQVGRRRMRALEAA